MPWIQYANLGLSYRDCRLSRANILFLRFALFSAYSYALGVPPERSRRYLSYDPSGSSHMARRLGSVGAFLSSPMYFHIHCCSSSSL